jgi:hypothetical protein
MEFQRILVADDKKANRDAAREAIPGATVVNSAERAIAYIQGHSLDLVITDMSMETRYAGLDVAQASMQRGVPVYTISNLGKGHGGDMVSLLPNYGKCMLFSRQGKADPKIWAEAVDSIRTHDAHRAYLNIGVVCGQDQTPLPKTVLHTIYGCTQDVAGCPEFDTWLNS